MLTKLGFWRLHKLYNTQSTWHRLKKYLWGDYVNYICRSLNLHIYPKVDHMLILLLTFEGRLCSFLKHLYHFTHSPKVQKCSHFSHPNQRLFLYSSHLNVWEMIFHFNFDLISLMISEVEYLCMCLLVIYISTFEK